MAVSMLMQNRGHGPRRFLATFRPIVLGWGSPLLLSLRRELLKGIKADARLSRRGSLAFPIYSFSLSSGITTSMSMINYNLIGIRTIMGATLGAILLFAVRGGAEEMDAAQVVKNMRTRIAKIE